MKASKKKITTSHLQDQIDQIKSDNNIKNNKNGYMYGFYILLTLFIILGLYMGIFITNSRKQFIELSNNSNKIVLEKESLQQLLNKTGSELSQANSKINSLQVQLNQKPTTIYVPQQESLKSSSNITCYPWLTGFKCY